MNMYFFYFERKSTFNQMYQSVDGDVNEPQQFVSLCTQPLIYTIQCQKWFIWFLPKPVLSLRGDIW